MSPLPLLYWHRKEGCHMGDFFITFIISVTAGVVCHLICKWLDRDKK